MSRNIYKILLVVLLAALFVSAVPLIGPSGTGWLVGSRWASVLLSSVILCVSAASLTYINRKFFAVTSSVEVLPLLYLLTALAEPSSLCLSEFHIVALLLPWSLYHIIRFISYERPKPSYYFFGILLVSSASIPVPSIVWLIPLIMLSVVFMCPEKGIKIFLMTSAGAVLPYIYLMSFMFFANRTDFSGYWTIWWDSASASGISFAGASLTRMFFMISLAVAVAMASFAVFRVYDMSSGAQKRVLRLSLIFTLSLFALRLFFGSVWDGCSAPVMMMPVSFILLNYLERHRDRVSFTLPAVLAAAAVVYRISAFL